VESVIFCWPDYSTDVLVSLSLEADIYLYLESEVLMKKEVALTQ